MRKAKMPSLGRGKKLQCDGKIHTMPAKTWQECMPRQAGTAGPSAPPARQQPSAVSERGAHPCMRAVCGCVRGSTGGP